MASRAGEQDCITCSQVLSQYINIVLSHLVVSDSATPWTVACQAPLSMGFPRQEYWSELLFPLPGDLPDPGIEPGSPTLQENSLLQSHL